MHATKWPDSSVKPSDFMEEKVSRHRRSQSDPIKRRVKRDRLSSIDESPHEADMELEETTAYSEARKRRLFNTDNQCSLKQEVLQLQRQLQDQFVVRRALERAISYRPLSHDATIEQLIPKPAQELLREIAVLELEVVCLERYLLSLYRKKFDQQISSLPTMEGSSKLTSAMQKDSCGEAVGNDIVSEKEDSLIHYSHLMQPQNSDATQPKECSDIWPTQKLAESSVYRCNSSLSQHSACLTKGSPAEFLTKAVDTYHSLPLSMLEPQNTTSNISLAEHLGTSISNNVPETPNWLSEEMIKCISAIYCELADPPLINHDYSSSPVTFSSSIYEHSSEGHSDRWSSQCKKFSSFNSNLDNPFDMEGSKEFSGPYCTMIKVQLICRESQKLKEVEYMLRRFR